MDCQLCVSHPSKCIIMLFRRKSHLNFSLFSFIFSLEKSVSPRSRGVEKSEERRENREEYKTKNLPTSFDRFFVLELVVRIELTTCSLRMSCSAIEPHQRRARPSEAAAKMIIKEDAVYFKYFHQNHRQARARLISGPVHSMINKANMRLVLCRRWNRSNPEYGEKT